MTAGNEREFGDSNWEWGGWGERFGIGVRILTFQAMIGNPRSESNHVYVRQSSLYLIMMLSNKAMWFLICASTKKKPKRGKKKGGGGCNLNTVTYHIVHMLFYIWFNNAVCVGFFPLFQKSNFH